MDVGAEVLVIEVGEFGIETAAQDGRAASGGIKPRLLNIAGTRDYRRYPWLLLNPGNSSLSGG